MQNITPALLGAGAIRRGDLLEPGFTWALTMPGPASVRGLPTIDLTWPFKGQVSLCVLGDPAYTTEERKLARGDVVA